MIPGRGAFVLLALWLPTAALAVAWEPLRALWLGAAPALALIAWMDLRALSRQPVPTASRRVPVSLALGVWTEVKLRVGNAGPHSIRVAVFDHHPGAARYAACHTWSCFPREAGQRPITGFDPSAAASRCSSVPSCC